MKKIDRLRLAVPAVLAVPGLFFGAKTYAKSSWPSSNIRMVVPFPPGGSSDILGRLIAENLGHRLNTNFIVENKPGATTQIGTELVANAQPDGNTLLLASASAFTALPNLRKLNFSVDSFEIAGGIADYVALMAVRKDLPIKTVQEFVAYAKENPGKLAFGSAGEASAGHIYGLTLARDTGIEVLHVPFRGSAAAVNALVAGDIDFIIDGAVSPMIKSNRVHPLASFYRKRHPDFPDLPTLDESGFRVSASRSSGWGLLAPKGTPANIMAQLSEALRQVLEQKDVQEILARANSVPSWQTPDIYRQGLLADRKMYAELLPAIGITGQ